MDDLAGPSFFDFGAAPHSTISSTLDIQNSGLDSVIKQETFDSTAWIQGCTDIPSGIDHGFTSFHTQGLKSTGFLQTQSTSYETASLENLISGSQTINSHPTPMGVADPLEMILNQPSIEDIKTEPKDSLAAQFSLVGNGMRLPGLSIPSPTSVTMQINTLGQSSPQIFLEGKNTLGASSLSSQESPISSNTSSAPPTTSSEPMPAAQPPKVVDPEKDLNLYLTNVVSSFRLRCHLNLRRIAQEGVNVIYQRETKKVVMRIRRPSCTAYVWSSGKVVCTGASSETAAKKAARKFARRLQSMGFHVIFSNFKVINVLAVCKMPYHIDIVEFSSFHRSKYLSYEPELHPAVTYRLPEWRVTFKIFSTGSITLTCPVVARIPEAVKRVYPMVKDFFRYDKPNDLSSSRKVSEDEEKEEDLS